MFATLSDRLTATFRTLRTRGRLSEADVDTTVREIRRALLDADVALPVVRSFTAAVRERALSAEVSQALNPAQQVVKIVHDELVTVLGGATRELQFAKNPPTVVLLAGLQGAGKTTLAGKLALWLREEGHTPLLVAADLQRPNAVTQLQVVGEQAGVPVFAPHPGNQGGGDAMPVGADPVAVARAGVVQAREKMYDVVIVDTAGRLGVDEEMMAQAAAIRDATTPDEVLFVVDAMIGQDAVNTARAFADGVGFTGVVLSKLDGDARGGAALSVTQVTGAPVLFASTGEKLADLEVFHPDRMASRILDMGDVLTLIEQAEKTFDAEQAEKFAEKLVKGEDFTLADFLSQLQQIRGAGPLKKMLGMLPGMGQMREALDSFDEREVDRVEAIIQSMTPAERANPKILNGSRRSRIAAGSGTRVSDINELMTRFDAAQTMMRQMARGGGMPGMPGMGRMPGSGKKAKGRSAQAPRRVKGKSGNPAKRAEQERAARTRASGGPAVAPGSSFGLGAQPDPSQFEVPEGLDRFLKG
ncbi:MAG: signal recognition particle protein [Micrococcales bacterium]|nr:signal recognition particle protein [Micrococcales bacterium]MCL2666898.1 signal recognition particle protein [Micrococcales bacterium]